MMHGTMNVKFSVMSFRKFDTSKVSKAWQVSYA